MARAKSKANDSNLRIDGVAFHRAVLVRRSSGEGGDGLWVNDQGEDEAVRGEKVEAVDGFYSTPRRLSSTFLVSAGGIEPLRRNLSGSVRLSLHASLSRSTPSNKHGLACAEAGNRDYGTISYKDRPANNRPSGLIRVSPSSLAPDKTKASTNSKKNQVRIRFNPTFRTPTNPEPTSGFPNLFSNLYSIYGISTSDHGRRSPAGFGTTNVTQRARTSFPGSIHLGSISESVHLDWLIDTYKLTFSRPSVWLFSFTSPQMVATHHL